MIDSATAAKLVLQYAQPGPTEIVHLSQALGRTLATAVTCDMDYPPFDRAMMDGFAVRARDVTTPGTQLRILGSVAAGSRAPTPLGSGETYQINTGAPMPDGADAVVPIEVADVAPNGESVTLQTATTPGKHVAPQSSCVSAGSVVLQAGLPLEPAEIATAAAAGATHVGVYARPTVAILATGDELVPIDCKPGEAQIRNSNTCMLEALVRRAGGEPVDLGIAGDNGDALRVAIREGLQHDALCITGGVSMGEYDLVPDALDHLGCTVRFKKVAIKPGKPTMFATSETGRYVFGLPGNPIGAMVTFLLFVEPVLRVRQGGKRGGRRHMNALLDSAMPPVGDRESYWPAVLSTDSNGHLRAKPLSWRGSGDPFGWLGPMGWWSGRGRSGLLNPAMRSR